MPSIGPMELVIVLVIVVLVFGAGRLPEVGSAVGKSLRELKTALHEEDSPHQQTKA